ncbi:MAG: hypothetical protein P8127_08360, partial [Acidobacteriota bacterium]
MVRKTPKGKSGKGPQGAAENVHQMPSSGRRRTARAEDPLAFPNVPTIVANASRAAVAANSDNVIEHWNDAAIELFDFTADEAI